MPSLVCITLPNGGTYKIARRTSAHVIRRPGGMNCTVKGPGQFTSSRCPRPSMKCLTDCSRPVHGLDELQPLATLTPHSSSMPATPTPATKQQIDGAVERLSYEIRDLA